MLNSVENAHNTASPEVKGINRQTAVQMSERKGSDIYELFTLSNRVREKFRGNRVDLCSIINAKSGACPEDCSFCAQSAKSKTNIDVHPLINRENREDEDSDS